MLEQRNLIGNFQLPEVKVSVTSSQPFNPQALPEIKTSYAAAQLLAGCFNQNTFYFQEEFFVILLNRSNRVLSYYHVSTGGSTGTVVDVRNLMCVVVSVPGVTGIILAHNHPSGGTKPSEADRNITQKIKHAATLLDIQVLDHIILSQNDGSSYFSFADDGII